MSTEECEVVNAAITSAEIYNCHGSLTAMLRMDTADGNYGIGGYALYSSPKDPANGCGYFLRRVIDVVGVESWNDLPGKHIRVNISKNAIGNIIKNDWFYPEQELKEVFTQKTL